jgi:hypothetical protein
MPVNHADFTLYPSIVLYPIAAGKAAIDAHAGWLMILLVLASLPAGAAAIYLSRKLIYCGMGLVLGDTPDQRGKWFQWLVGAPALLIYFVLPYALTAGGLCAVWFGTRWLVPHLL